MTQSGGIGVGAPGPSWQRIGVGLGPLSSEVASELGAGVAAGGATETDGETVACAAVHADAPRTPQRIAAWKTREPQVPFAFTLAPTLAASLNGEYPNPLSIG
jgi:hypothetical protein